MVSPRRRKLLAACALGGLTGIGGCLGGQSPTGTTESSPTATATATAAPPDYATCSAERRPAATVTEYPDPPDEYTEVTVAAYLRGFERAFKRNELHREDDVQYVTFKTTQTSATAVEHGFTGTVEVEIGYGTSVSRDGEQYTLHADQPYVASYFVNRAVVWRAEGSGPIDVRKTDFGTLVVCRNRARDSPSTRTDEY